MIETPDMSVEIARRTRACWMRIRWDLRELYDQPKVALSPITRMVNEAIEALLYGCSTWTLRQEHYSKLPTVHHRGTAQETRPSDDLVHLVLTHGIPPDFRDGVHLFIPPHASDQSRLYQVTQVRTDGIHCRESAGTGPVVV